jgi:hypothetical protein
VLYTKAEGNLNMSKESDVSLSVSYEVCVESEDICVHITHHLNLQHYCTFEVKNSVSVHNESGYSAGLYFST